MGTPRSTISPIAIQTLLSIWRRHDEIIRGDDVPRYPRVADGWDWYLCDCY